MTAMTEPTPSPSDATGAQDRFLVACLCAEWCTSCRAYRAVFDQAADQHPDVRFVWIDVEDSAALVDQVDVENFPTVLIGKGEHPRFFGVITPQSEVLLRLIAAHRERAAVSGSVAAEVSDLLRRLQAFAG